MTRILIADDIEQNLYMLRFMLENSGYQVYQAANGIEALEILREQTVEMIVSDILMPEMDGYQFCRECKAHPDWADIPFIFYTATYTSKEDERFSLALGASRFILKPQQPVAFLQTIHEVLEQWHAGQLDVKQSSIGDDVGYLKLYNERLIHKLEDKLDQLEKTNNQLSRELAAHQQAESKARLLLHAMEHTDTAILIIDHAGNIEYLNATFSAMFGIDEQDLINKAITSLHGDAIHTFQQQIWPAISQAESWHGKLNYQHDELSCTVLMSINPIFDDEQRHISHFIISQRDISEQQSMQEQLYAAQKMEAIGTLAGGIAHDFNNILAGIMMNIYLMQHDLKQGESIQKGLNVINTSCEKASSLVKQMLTFARKDLVSFEPLSLTDTFEQAVALAQLNVPANIQLQCEFPSDALHSRGSLVQVEQLLINLINNARDAVEHVEQPCIQLRLEKTTLDKANAIIIANAGLPAGDYAHLTLSDNGEGMQDTSKIFDPFYTSKEQGKGTGLGLAMVYGSVQRHHGYITVESQAELGSTFHIYLPLVLAHSDANTATATPIIAGQAQWLLLADDEDFVRNAMFEVLTQLGFNVITASDGQQALDAFQRHHHKIDLVILDIIMPHLSGLDAAKAMRDTKADLPVIFATGYAKSNILNLELKQFKNSTVFSKPFQIADLSCAIHKLLQDKKPAAHSRASKAKTSQKHNGHST